MMRPGGAGTIAAAVGVFGAGIGVLVATNESVAGYLVSLGALVVAIAGPLVRRETVRRAASPRKLVDEKLDALAEILREQWADEELVRRGRVTWPMPVRFSVPQNAASVMASWSTIRAGGDGTPLDFSGVYDTFGEVFNGPDSPKRFVVLGEAGAGKSLLALKLGLELLGEPGDRTPDRVPVLLSIGAWKPSENESVDDWVVHRLGEDYPFLRRTIRSVTDQDQSIARLIVKQHRIVPILDGLDEMAETNRGAALRALSEAARRGDSFVVTCRTDAYIRLVRSGRLGADRIERTPVVELKPLTVDDMAAWLRRSARDTSRNPAMWDVVIDKASREPDGPLARTLSIPFALWLACITLKDDIPAELVAQTDSEKILGVLLDDLIPAAYDQRVHVAPLSEQKYPHRSDEQVDAYRSTLIHLAAHVKTEAGDSRTYDLAWWRLHRAREVIRPLEILTGIVTAIPCAIGFATCAQFGSDWKNAVGAVLFGAVLGLLSARAAVHGAVPRIVNIHWNLRQSAVALSAGLAVGLAFGLVYAATADLHSELERAAAIGIVTGISGFCVLIGQSGIEAGVEMGLAMSVIFGFAAYLPDDHSVGRLATGLVMGITAGVCTVVSAGIYQQAERGRAISPEGLLHSARLSVLTVVPACGITVGAAFGTARGPQTGIAAGIITVVGILFATTPWGQFVLVRLVLTVRTRAPLRFVAFLKEAHARGILRQVGGVYQFRHGNLADHLAGQAAIEKR